MGDANGDISTAKEFSISPTESPKMILEYGDFRPVGEYRIMSARMVEARRDIDAVTHRTTCAATMLGVGSCKEDMMITVFTSLYLYE